jgi:predicted nuclease of predicted toxin-antitoxin system
MKFIVDAQLPRPLAHRLHAAGHDAVHTLDLPPGNRTPDAEVCRLADSERRIVLTKDADFVSSFLLRRQPQRLFLISLGNCANLELERRVVAALPTIVLVLADPGFLELTAAGLVVHGR